MLARSSVFLISGNKNYFFYGFNKNLKIEIVDLSKFQFNLNNIGGQNKKPEKILNNNSNKTKKIIWIFGASLTYGFACGDSSSSWGNELEKINDNIEVKNFGFPSIFSDDSIKILDFEIKKNSPKPDYIFWAHRDEEMLSIIRGLGRNKYKINVNDSNSSMSKIKYVLMRIKKTFETNFVSYLILDHAIKKIQIKNELFPDAKKNTRFDKKDYSLSSINFELNTNDAIKIAKKRNIEFFIISLFSDDQFLKSDKIKFNHYYNKTVKKITNKNDVTYIDTFKLLLPDDKNNYEKFFCENKHYTLKGNQEIARLINNNLE